MELSTVRIPYRTDYRRYATHRIFQMLLRRRGLHIRARGELACLLRRSQLRRHNRAVSDHLSHVVGQQRVAFYMAQRSISGQQRAARGSA